MSQTSAVVPRMRGLGQRWWGIGVLFALGVSGTFAVWFKYAVVERRKRHYKEFYEQWDDDKEYQAMKEAGVFKGFEDAS